MKWSNDDSLQVFQNITNQENNYRSMFKWVKNVCKQLPMHYANILIFCTLTGLRPTEAFNSINIIRSDLDNYLDKEEMILKHIKYPSISLEHQESIYQHCN
ncbi:MAG: hypothetical protein ACRD8K_11255 [Nitrososphaeraceae archaeon]